MYLGQDGKGKQGILLLPSQEVFSFVNCNIIFKVISKEYLNKLEFGFYNDYAWQSEDAWLRTLWKHVCQRNNEALHVGKALPRWEKKGMNLKLHPHKVGPSLLCVFLSPRCPCQPLMKRHFLTKGHGQTNLTRFKSPESRNHLLLQEIRILMARLFWIDLCKMPGLDRI